MQMKWRERVGRVVEMEGTPKRWSEVAFVWSDF